MTVTKRSQSKDSPGSQHDASPPVLMRKKRGCFLYGHDERGARGERDSCCGYGASAMAGSSKSSTGFGVCGGLFASRRSLHDGEIKLRSKLLRARSMYLCCHGRAPSQQTRPTADPVPTQFEARCPGAFDCVETASLRLH